MIREFQKEDFLTEQEVSASRKWIKGRHIPHWHDFYEVEYVFSGSGSYLINGQNFAVEEGMLYFMTPIDFHCADTGRTEIFNVMFSENQVSFSSLAPFTYHTAPKAIMIPEQMRSFVVQLLQEIVDHQADRTYSAALLECLLIKLSHSLVDVGKECCSSLARKMQFYVINHFREKLTLEDAANYVGLTLAYASAVFKKEMNINFKKYLNELRFSYARKLLTCSDLSVIQICGECGFEDYPNFIRRFKEHFGMTPSEVREKHIHLP